MSTGQVDDNTTVCLLNYNFVKGSYRLIAVDLSKHKALDADARAIQQIVSQGAAAGNDNIKLRVYTILEKSKETVLEFHKRTEKVSQEYIK